MLGAGDEVESDDASLVPLAAASALPASRLPRRSTGAASPTTRSRRKSVELMQQGAGAARGRQIRGRRGRCSKPRWRSIRATAGAYVDIARVAEQAAALRQGDPHDQQGAGARAERSRRDRGPGRSDGRAGRDRARPGKSRKLQTICAKGCPQVAQLQAAISRGPTVAAAKPLRRRPRRTKPSARASATNSLDAEGFGAPLGIDAQRCRAPRARPASLFRLERSILRRWPNAAAVSSLEHLPDRRPRAHRCGTMWTTADVDLGRRHEGRAADLHRDSRRRAPLRRDRQPAVGVAARRRDDPLGDLFLEHQGQRSPPRRPVAPPSQRSSSAVPTL